MAASAIARRIASTAMPAINPVFELLELPRDGCLDAVLAAAALEEADEGLDDKEIGVVDWLD